jgi:hypothetical protein
LWQLALFFTLILGSAACPADPAADVPDAAARRHRDSGTGPFGSCLHCAMIAQLLSGGGIGGGMDPCASGGPGGGTGGFTFCNETVFNSFVGCLQTSCAASCPFGMAPAGGMMCPADGGTPPPPPDASTPADGAATSDGGSKGDGGSEPSCVACLMAKCAAQYSQCGEDK